MSSKNTGNLQGFFNFFVINLIATLAWLIPRLFRHFFCMYAIDLIRKFYRFSKVTGDLLFFSESGIER
ncbi:MAG: hypothetical protein BRC41_02725 [Cyanobacteria bacterium QH_9_48_43]|nr:MAG: hypothetical protein BRC41_02725 [Cyanobacteria bacterium QH_9_48_43]